MTRTSSTDVVWHHATVTRPRRETLNGHQGAVLWLTGLSGSGKSTIAHALEETLHTRGCRTYVLDGDNIRHGLCGDLGFSREHRQENIRRIAEASHLFVDAGLIVMTAFISPFREDRERARTLLANSNFVEIHCACSSEVCEQRDVKGLYRKARQGLIPEFTGISSPYEPPENPELTLDTATQSIDESVAMILEFLIARGIVPAA
jgi:adenylylsulfate kinase